MIGLQEGQRANSVDSTASQSRHSLRHKSTNNPPSPLIAYTRRRSQGHSFTNPPNVVASDSVSKNNNTNNHEAVLSPLPSGITIGATLPISTSPLPASVLRSMNSMSPLPPSADGQTRVTSTTASMLSSSITSPSVDHNNSTVMLRHHTGRLQHWKDIIQCIRCFVQRNSYNDSMNKISLDVMREEGGGDGPLMQALFSLTFMSIHSIKDMLDTIVVQESSVVVHYVLRHLQQSLDLDVLVNLISVRQTVHTYKEISV